MTFDRFKGQGPIPGYEPDEEDQRHPLRNPNGYRAGEALAQAVNVALALEMPLLVTGEPGTGKTQLGYRMAAELGLGRPLRFDTKSSSQAMDLFYQFDSVRQFAQSQLNAAARQALPEASEFLEIRPLGRAILESLEPQAVAGTLGPRLVRHPHPRRSLVLIDEIDKAPRDFPNDLLNQIENLQFTLHELGNQTFQASRDFAPVILITSNSEKQLPEPFLRRCVYHHIEFPQDEQALGEILGSRLRQLEFEGSPAYAELVRWFFALRKDVTLAKKPSTSELLDWLRVLHQAGLDKARPIEEQRATLKGCLGSLLKMQQDIERVTARLDDRHTRLL
jgi:MoxR-like ATPase